MAKPYRKDIDFAFFVANFNYSKKDYEDLTPKERAFILKAWEEKKVSDTMAIYNACYAAFFNANRDKKQRPIKLFERRTPVDKELIKENEKIVREASQNNKSWVDKIYRKLKGE